MFFLPFSRKRKRKSFSYGWRIHASQFLKKHFSVLWRSHSARECANQRRRLAFLKVWPTRMCGPIEKFLGSFFSKRNETPVFHRIRLSIKVVLMQVFGSFCAKFNAFAPKFQICPRAKSSVLSIAFCGLPSYNSCMDSNGAVGHLLTRSAVLFGSFSLRSSLIRAGGLRRYLQFGNTKFKIK